ncbi:MAG: hydroxymethylglutaryl-CoA lyase [Thermodesulfobacteriota bacterium]
MEISWTPPPRVFLREVGPRDGFQNEKTPIPLEAKARLIRRLAEAGFSHIQAFSFVNPRRVPQMADAEALAETLGDLSSVTLSGLALNLSGVRRAASAGVRLIEIGASASPAHSLANTGMTQERALDALSEMAASARGLGMETWAGLHCAFGGPGDEEVPPDRAARLAERILSLSPACLVLADTTGSATPPSVAALLRRVLPLAGSTPVLLHLHDTRGLGLVNLFTALSLGVGRFDTSFGGLGGCPFIAGAAGNIATEDALFLLESLGLSAGVSGRGVAACSRSMEKLLGRVLPGRMHRLHQTDDSGIF